MVGFLASGQVARKVFDKSRGAIATDNAFRQNSTQPLESLTIQADIDMGFSARES